MTTSAPPRPAALDEDRRLRAALLDLSDAELAAWLDGLTDAEVEDLEYRWSVWARDEQLEPAGLWRFWWIKAGRGFGKTRSGAETIKRWAHDFEWLSIIAPTADDARDICIEGESGILAVSPRWWRPTFNPSKRRLTWPNGARATYFTADEPERLRGKQHQRAWLEEPASWRYPEAWDQFLFGLRLPPDPRAVITGTPKPTRVILEIARDPATVITGGSTYENMANLAPAAAQAILGRYEGTRLGRQELEAELLEDVPGALWTRSTIQHRTVAEGPLDVGALKRIGVGMDPSVSDGEDASHTGIVAAGVGWDGRGYVLADRSTRGTPRRRAVAAVKLALELGAEAIVVETNNGGDWLPAVIRPIIEQLAEPGQQRPRVVTVKASRGKVTRAEPVAAQYEQGVWQHAPIDPPREGARGPIPPLSALEDQMVMWVEGDPSPDRLDALVWVATWLHPDGKPRSRPTRTAADAGSEAERRAGRRPITEGMKGRQW